MALNIVNAENLARFQVAVDPNHHFTRFAFFIFIMRNIETFCGGRGIKNVKM
jgi:hypothetical protein